MDEIDEASSGAERWFDRKVKEWLNSPLNNSGLSNTVKGYIGEKKSKELFDILDSPTKA